MDEANLPDPRRTLNELGFDSLTAVEFCNRVGRSIGQHLNPAVLFDYPTLESLAGYVVRDVLHLESAERSAAAAPRPQRSAAGAGRRGRHVGSGNGRLGDAAARKLHVGRSDDGRRWCSQQLDEVQLD